MQEKNFNYSTLSDEELVELSAGGDKRATEIIFSRYKNLVKNRAKAYYLAGADHDDIVQEGMIGLFKAIRDFDVTKQPLFRSFADLCIKRNMISAVKSSTRKKHSPLNSYISLSEPVFDDNEERTLEEMIIENNSSNPEDMFLQREKTELLNQEIESKLSKLEKSVLVRYLNGMNYNDIAAELNRTPKSIDNALQRIKHKLNKVD